MDGFGVLVFFVISSTAWGMATRKVIVDKGYEENWFWLGFFFTFIAFILALLRPAVSKEYIRSSRARTRNSNEPSDPSEETVQFASWSCPCGRQNASYIKSCACGRSRETATEQLRKRAAPVAQMPGPVQTDSSFAFTGSDPMKDARTDLVQELDKVKTVYKRSYGKTANTSGQGKPKPIWMQRNTIDVSEPEISTPAIVQPDVSLEPDLETPILIKLPASYSQEQADHPTPVWMQSSSAGVSKSDMDLQAFYPGPVVQDFRTAAPAAPSIKPAAPVTTARTAAPAAPAIKPEAPVTTARTAAPVAPANVPAAPVRTEPDVSVDSSLKPDPVVQPKSQQTQLLTKAEIGDFLNQAQKLETAREIYSFLYNIRDRVMTQDFNLLLEELRNCSEVERVYGNSKNTTILHINLYRNTIAF